jgi:hypothetical protein
MDVTEIVSTISSVGFPIVAACGMFYLYDNTIKNITNTLNLINQTLCDVKQSTDELIKKIGE